MKAFASNTGSFLARCSYKDWIIMQYLVEKDSASEKGQTGLQIWIVGFRWTRIVATNTVPSLSPLVARVQLLVQVLLQSQPSSLPFLFRSFLLRELSSFSPFRDAFCRDAILRLDWKSASESNLVIYSLQFLQEIRFELLSINIRTSGSWQHFGWIKLLSLRYRWLHRLLEPTNHFA